MRPVTVFKVLYVLGVASLLLLLVARIAQVRRSQKAFAALPDYSEVQRFDPEREGGHLLPGLDEVVKTDRSTKAARFITNSKGFRNDREFSYQHPASTYRIALVGDSYIDGMRTDQKRTIGFLLEAALNQRRPKAGYDRYEVMISGHNNPTNAWYWYQEYGRRYHPDLLLLGVTLGNDLAWNNFRATFVPVVDGGRAALAKTERRGLDEHKGAGVMIPDAGYVADRSGAQRCANELRLRERLASWSTLLDNLAPPVLNPLPSTPGHVFATDFSVCLGLFYAPVMPEMEKIYADFEESLAGFGEAVEATGSRFAVVLLPERIQVVDGDWGLLARLYLLDPAHFDREYPDRRLLDYAKQHGLTATDALPWLRAAATEYPWTRLFRARGDMHYNEKGQEVVAAGLYDFVRALVEEPAAAAPVATPSP